MTSQHLLPALLACASLFAACNDDQGAGSPEQPPSIPLTKDLCDDAANMERLGDPTAQAGQATYGEVQPEQLRRMAAAPTDGPFYMINLVRFRDRARYPDGRQTDLTGREADALYAPIEFLSAIGARIVFVGKVGEVLIGEADAWEQVAIVEYPCPVAFFAMTADPAFRARAIHKEAGVEATIVMATELAPSPLPKDFVPPQSPFPATAEDPAFEMIHVLRYRDQAQYKDGVDEPARTGREAMDLYTSGAAEAATRVGVYPTGWFKVQGVLIGDGRPWDEVRLNHMPSRAGFDSLVKDPTRQDGQHHREAALEHTYSLVTYPELSAIPGAPAAAGSTPPPVTDDGTGTLCEADDECPGDGVDKCVVAEGATGFCTRQGCGAGDCEAPYVCCRGCSEVVAAFLPFSGSACFPGDQVERLVAAPASCTCD